MIKLIKLTLLLSLLTTLIACGEDKAPSNNNPLTVPDTEDIQDNSTTTTTIVESFDLTDQSNFEINNTFSNSEQTALYELYSPTAATLTVNVSSSTAEINIKLLDDKQSFIVNSVVDGDSATLIVELQAGQTYYILVNGDNTLQNVEYVLNLEMSNIPDNITFVETDPVTGADYSPVVEAGNNIDTLTGQSVLLVGSATDLDSLPGELTYTWNINGQNYQGSTVNIVMNTAGNYHVRLTVYDGFNYSFDNMSLNVTDLVLNTAPTANPQQVGDLLIANAYDPDGDNLDYKWKIGSTILGANAYYDITDAPAVFTGSQVVTLEISDATTTFYFQMSDIDFGADSSNTPPVISAINSVTATIAVPFTLSGFATDADIPAQNLIYSWQINGIIYNGANVNVVLNVVGEYIAIFTVSDGEDTVNYTILVTVGDAVIQNTAPIVDIFQSGDLLYAIAADVDSDALTYVWKVESLVVGTSSTFDINNAPSSITGNQVVQLDVSDGFDVTTVFINDIDFGTVPTNQAPVVNAGSNINATVGVVFILSGSATDADTPAQNLSYNWEINGQTYNGATVTVVINSVGEYTAAFIVSDGEYIVTDEIAVTVEDVIQNTAPSAEIIQSGELLFAIATDVDFDSLTYVWTVESLVVGTSSIFDLNNTPSSITGNQVVQLDVSDGFDITTVFISDIDFGTAPTNQTPVVISIDLISTNLVVTATDDQSVSALTYSWTVANVPVVATGSIIVAPSVTGYQLVTVIATDASGLSSATYQTVIDFGEEGVDPTNTAPTITLAVVSNNLLIAIAADNETSVLSYTWKVGSTTIGTGTPLPLSAVNSVNGIQNVTLVVSDGSLSVTTIVVNVDFGTGPVVDPSNLAPVITSAALIGSNLVAVATDDQSTANLTYTWTIAGTPAATSGATIAAPSGLTGSKVVVVTVTDAGGLYDTETFTANFGGGTGPVVVDLTDPAIIIIDAYNGDIALDQQVIGNTSASLQTAGNPFADAYFYLNPDISTMIDYSLERVADDALIEKMKYVQKQPSAIWMDSTAAITQEGGDGSRRTLIGHLDAALMQQEYYNLKDGGQSPMTVVIIVYNLPDRNCASFASNGKLIQVGQYGRYYEPGVLGMGYTKYRDEYLAPIAAAFSDPKYASLRIVAMLEPDAFPNMIVNSNESNTNPLLSHFPALMNSGGYCDKILNFNNDTVVPPVTGEGNAANPNLGLYADSLRLAIHKMHEASLVNHNIYTYMDIGQAGLLGWDMPSDVTDEYPGYEDPDTADGIPDYLQTNMKRAVRYFKQLIDGADGKIDGLGMDWVRGFASNTANYTPIEEPLISHSAQYLDLKDLESFYQYNPSVDENSYIDNLNYYFTTADPAGYFGTQKFEEVGFIIDTARNGWGAKGDDRPKPGVGTKGFDPDARVDTRTHRSHWCNVNDAGVGEVPKAAPDAGRPYLDAFFWMKPPGESDGISFDIYDYPMGGQAFSALDYIEKDIVTQSNHPAYLGKSLDTMCIPGEVRGDTLTNVVPQMAPHAGSWFHYQFIMLINNAYPVLGESDYD